MVSGARGMECVAMTFVSHRHVMIGLTLSQTTNFRLFQTERACRRQFKFNENGGQFFKWIENIVGKGENCSLRAISPFPTVFSKDLYCRHVKTRACLGKG